LKVHVTRSRGQLANRARLKQPDAVHYPLLTEIPQNDILDVLGANGSSTEHGESSLHKVDERTGENEVEGIDASPETVAVGGLLIRETLEQSWEIVFGAELRRAGLKDGFVSHGDNTLLVCWPNKQEGAMLVLLGIIL